MMLNISGKLKVESGKLDSITRPTVCCSTDQPKCRGAHWAPYDVNYKWKAYAKLRMEINHKEPQREKK